MPIRAASKAPRPAALLQPLPGSWRASVPPARWALTAGSPGPAGAQRAAQSGSCQIQQPEQQQLLWQGSGPPLHADRGLELAQEQKRQEQEGHRSDEEVEGPAPAFDAAAGAAPAHPALLITPQSGSESSGGSGSAGAAAGAKRRLFQQPGTTAAVGGQA
jgi:hypothetical protein